jgi:hypothetical protein
VSDKFQQEQELKTALQRIYKNIEIPDSTVSWIRIQAILKKRRRRKQWVRRLKISSMIVISSFILNLVFTMTVPTAYSHITGLFKKIKNDVIEFFHERPDQNNNNNSKAKTSSPNENSEKASSKSGQMIEVTIEEARTKLSFHLLLPTYVPGSFQLDSVRIFSETEEEYYNNVQLEYVNENGEVLNIIQRRIEGETPGLKAEMAIGSGEYKDVIINGNAAILMTPIEGNTNVEWLTQDRILIRISGKLAGSDIIKFASSLK